MMGFRWDFVARVLGVLLLFVSGCADEPPRQGNRLRSLTPSAALLTLPIGAEAQILVSGEYADGTRENVTARLLWTSSDVGVVEVSSGFGEEGRVHAVATGSATITAEDVETGLTTSVAVDVTNAQLVGMRVTPAQATLPVGLSTEFTVTADYSDGMAVDVTSQATFATDAPLIASFMTGPTNRLQAIAVGSAQITVSFDGQSQILPITVIRATLERIDLQAPTRRLDVGQSTRLRALATFSDGSAADVTETATWSSSDLTLFPVSNVANERGTVSVTAYLAGASANITASWQESSASVVISMGCPHDALTGFAGGAGTDVSPYLLCNSGHILELASSADNWVAGKNYLVIDDIDMARSGVVMGTFSQSFQANLDGGGHVIRNMLINRTDLSIDVGFIGFLRAPGSVRRLHLRGAEIVGTSQVGGIFGSAWDGLVEDCTFEGSVSATQGSAGGIAGATWTATIRRVAARGAVTAAGAAAGGVVADVGTGTTIANVYSRATVDAELGDCGGIIGFYRGDAPTSFAYATGAVTSTAPCGGLAGRVPTTAVTFSGLFWDPIGTGVASPAGVGTMAATALTPAQLAQPPSFIGWDFDAVWEQLPGDIAPVLRGQPAFD